MQIPKNYHIHLATRLNTPIDNEQQNVLSGLESHNASQLREQFRDRAQAQFLSGPCPVYNCHGLTFASRRTMPDVDYVQVMLREDGFEKVGTPQVGDIVIYFDEDGNIDHSGLVVELRDSVLLGKKPFILSKWGKGSEVLHSVTYSPYGSRFAFYRIKTWDKQNSKISSTTPRSQTILTSSFEN